MKLTTRQEGTKVFKTETNQDKIDALRIIVNESQYAVVNGQAMDLFTASAIVTVYDALNDNNKERYIKSEIPMMAKIAFQLLKDNKAVA